MTKKKSFYITTSIPYANDVPHIGHAYEMIATDVIARFKSLDGYDVLFVTGTDEHGQKMLKTSEKKGKNVNQLAKENSKVFKNLLISLNCKFDDFIRTTESRHKIVAQEIWRRMKKNGDIYLEKYSGWYSIRDEMYCDEKDIVKKEDGFFISSTGDPVKWIEEDSYFFRLSAYEDKLLFLYKNNPKFIVPNIRYNEVIKFIKGGLRDFSISRTTFSWGINVPDDNNHIMYVWVDALINYLTGAGFLIDNKKFNKYWPCNLHIIGKDILRFHGVYWPAILMSAKIKLPKRIFGHGFIKINNKKMSKSIGNVINPSDLINKYKIDKIRYFFMAEIPFGKDGNYNHSSFINKTNSDLVNNLGNLSSRSLSMIINNCNGIIPVIKDLTIEDQKLINLLENTIIKVRKVMENEQIHLAISIIWNVISKANKYFTIQEPWILQKTNPVRMGVVLGITAEVIRQVAIMLQPYIPNSASKFLDILNIDIDKRNFIHLSKDNWLKSGSKINKPYSIFLKCK